MDHTLDEPRSWGSAPVDADKLLRILRAVKAALDGAPEPGAPEAGARNNGDFQDAAAAGL